MSSFKTVALGLAVVFASAVGAQAATHMKPAHRAAHPAHAMRHSGSAARGPAPTSGATSADRSADALNAQSLTRAQGAQ